jgi:hypothetical protein
MDESALNAIIENLYALYDGSESIEVAADSQRVAVLAHGWYTHVRRNGRALQVLTNAGFEHEGAPLRRSMIEHALGLHWLADAAEDAVDALLTGHRETWKKIAGSMTDGWPVTPEDLNPVLSIVIPKSSESTYLAFKHLCGRYDEPDLYVAWLLETGHSHASYASAAAYVEGDGTAAGTKLLEKAANPPQATAGVVANLLFIASVGFNKTLTGQPWAGRLGEVHARRGIAIAGAGRAKS